MKLMSKNLDIIIIIALVIVLFASICFLMTSYSHVAITTIIISMFSILLIGIIYDNTIDFFAYMLCHDDSVVKETREIESRQQFPIHQKLSVITKAFEAERISNEEFQNLIKRLELVIEDIKNIKEIK